jgi:hypothetical protein
MNIPAEKWYSAVKKRTSRRQYHHKLIEKRKIKKLQSYIDDVNDEFSGVRIQLIKKDVEEVFTGVVGNYGKVSGAPTYIAFIADPEVEHSEEKLGYIGESVILEATSLGLGTCWISGTFDQNEVDSDLNLKDTEKIYAVSPLGYPEEKPTISERILKAVVSSKKRLPLEELVLNEIDSEWPEWVMTALETARLAPSAMNRQPWRFRVEDNTIRVLLKGKNADPRKTKRLDCGIAMLHLEIGALKEGVTGDWEYFEGQNVARFTADI